MSRFYRYGHFLGAIAMIGMACGDESPPSPTPEGTLAILAIGDSRVEGARPEFESYRYELWKNLVTANASFNLVGPLQDEAAYPAFMGMTFDTDHGGIGGDQTTDVLARLDETLDSGGRPPDAVLLGIGGNDLLDGGRSVETVIENIQTIITRIQARSSSTVIFLEQIAPARSDLEGFQASLAQFQSFNAQVSTLASDTVIVIDMAQGWSDSLLADEVHYNEAGAKQVADRYFAAMQTQFPEL